MNPRNIKIALYLITFSTLFSACDLPLLLRKNNPNELIPNYSSTLLFQDLSPSMQSNIIALNDDAFVTAIENTNHEISIVEITQSFSNDQWNLNTAIVTNVGIGKLQFFNKSTTGYLIAYRAQNGNNVLQSLDVTFNNNAINNTYETFIDTFYNNIDSLHLSDFAQVQENDHILLGGQVFTQGTSFSCLLTVDQALNPIDFKTYFENSTIIDLKSINEDGFILVNNSPEGADLIRDNQNSSAYKKYDLSNDQLFFGNQSLLENQSLFLTGIHNDIARTIELNLSNNTAFINELEIYQATTLKAVFLTRNNILTAGIQKEENEYHQFSSELGADGSIWCHRYIDESYHSILDIIEMPEKGILISSIVNRNNKFQLHLTRIDEEGATFTNEYTENCI